MVVRKKMASKESGTIKKCGPVGVGMALLEEVCYCGSVLQVSYVQAMPNVTDYFLLLKGQNVEPLPQPACHQVTPLLIMD